MLKKWNISKKLTLILVAFSVFSSLLMSTLFYFQFKLALTERVLLQLSSVKQLKMVKVQTEIQDRMNLFDQVDPVNTAIDQFRHIDVYSNLPVTIGHFKIPKVGKMDHSIQLIDLTDQDTHGEIVLGFIKKISNGYQVGISAIPEIQAILLERTGLGETGESYLVGENYRLLTKSRTENQNTQNIMVKSEGVIRAFGGQPGEDRFIDYRNIEVFGAYEQIRINGLNWVLLSEINVQEALSPLYDLQVDLVLIAIVILLFILILSYGISKMIVSPIVTVEKKLMRMSQGMLEQPAPIDHRSDEIGHMFEALNKLINTLEGTVLFADKIGSGDFDAAYEPISGHDKIGEALVNMKNQLKEFKENERRLIQENQRSILSGEEKERARLSKEMHDGLGPLLTTLRMNIQLSDIGQNKEKLLKMLDETITEVRRMSNNLMPSVLTDFGAGEAIANLVDQLQQASGVNFRFKNDMSMESQIPENIQIALYRIAQEALNNALKHSSATEIRVSLTEFEDHIGLFISDNGRGFDQENVNYGNGVRNMKERVNLLNGAMHILSNEEGTTLEIEIPVL